MDVAAVISVVIALTGIGAAASAVVLGERAVRLVRKLMFALDAFYFFLKQGKKCSNNGFIARLFDAASGKSKRSHHALNFCASLAYGCLPNGW